jgi:hypothetical protein
MMMQHLERLLRLNWDREQQEGDHTGKRSPHRA